MSPVFVVQETAPVMECDVIDRLPAAPQVVVVSLCSGHGFKFASAIGEIVADLALDGGTSHDVSVFRIDRFNTGE